MKKLLNPQGMLKVFTIIITDLLVLLTLVIAPPQRNTAPIAAAQKNCRLSFADIRRFCAAGTQSEVNRLSVLYK